MSEKDEFMKRATAFHDGCWAFAEQLYEKSMARNPKPAHMPNYQEQKWAEASESVQMVYFERAVAFFAVGQMMYGDDFAYKVPSPSGEPVGS